MARIRSIKPEFWSDGKVRRLSDTTALFFIALWNFCDDAGYFELDTLELATKTSRWRSQDMMRLLWSLHGQGMVRLSRGDGVGMVASWSHQRIDKPRPSKWEGKEIQWDDAPPLRDSSKTVPRKDRIGSDRIGSDPSEGVQAPASGETELVAVTPLAVRKRRTGEAVTGATWEAYSAAYRARYGEPPVRNASVSGKLAQFVARIGAAEAPQVAAFFLSHSDRFYVQAMHAVGLLLRDAEKLRTEWATGARVTSGQARQVEQKQNVIDVWGPLIAEAQRKEREGA